MAARVERQPGGASAPRFGLPNLGVGVGLRTAHYAHILEHSPEVAWFEVLSDNYLHTRGRPLEILDRIAERYPVALHGVSLNLGSVEPLDREYIRELKALRDRVGAHWVSDHVCFTGVAGRNTHDLLPLPLNAFYQAFRDELAPAPPAAAASSIVVHRVGLSVYRLELEPRMRALLGDLLAGRTLGAALGELERRLSPHELAGVQALLSEWFGAWVAAGFFTALELD